MCAGVCLVLAASAAAAQKPDAAACDKGQASANCPPAAPAPSAAQRFPFPGEETPAPEAPSAVKPKSSPPAYPGDPEAPAASATQQKKAPPAYPGDPEAPAKNADDGFSSSSSSARTDEPAADEPPLKDAGSSGEVTKPAKRRKLPKIEAQTPEARESEDLDVAEFYSRDGNYGAAYTRAKDAVSIMPNDPFAHFALAEAARKLNKPEEAREHYSAVLKLDPNPKQEKASAKALAELAGTARK